LYLEVLPRWAVKYLCRAIDVAIVDIGGIHSSCHHSLTSVVYLVGKDDYIVVDCGDGNAIGFLGFIDAVDLNEGLIEGVLACFRGDRYNSH